MIYCNAFKTQTLMYNYSVLFPHILILQIYSVDGFFLLVTYASTESSDGSPLHQVATPGPIDCSTQTSPMVVTYPPLPTYSQLNYAPVSERDNSYIQERIQALANIVEEILPGRGATIGEFVLFQYLLHRPPPNNTQD